MLLINLQISRHLYPFLATVLCSMLLASVAHSGPTDCSNSGKAPLAKDKLSHLLAVVHNNVQSDSFQELVSATLFSRTEGLQLPKPIIATGDQTETKPEPQKKFGFSAKHIDSVTFQLTLLDITSAPCEISNDTILEYLDFSINDTGESYKFRLIQLAAWNKTIEDENFSAIFKHFRGDTQNLFNSHRSSNWKNTIPHKNYVINYRIFRYFVLHGASHPDVQDYPTLSTDEIVSFPLNQDSVASFSQLINATFTNLQAKQTRDFYYDLLSIRCEKDCCPLERVPIATFIAWCKKHSPHSELFASTTSLFDPSSFSCSMFQTRLSLPCQDDLVQPSDFLERCHRQSLTWEALQTMDSKIFSPYYQKTKVSLLPADELRVLVMKKVEEKVNLSKVKIQTDLSVNDLSCHLSSVLFKHTIEVIEKYVNDMFKQFLTKITDSDVARTTSIDSISASLKTSILSILFDLENLSSLPVLPPDSGSTASTDSNCQSPQSASSSNKNKQRLQDTSHIPSYQLVQQHLVMQLFKQISIGILCTIIALLLIIGAVFLIAKDIREHERLSKDPPVYAIA